MFCTKCGKQLVDNAAFCTECGERFNANDNSQPVITPVQPVANGTAVTYNDGTASNKKIFAVAGIAIAIVILIAVIAIIAVNSGGSGYTLVSKMYSEPIIDDNGIHIFYGSKQLTADCEGENSNDYYYNNSKTAIAVFTDENELFFAHNGKLELVAEDKELDSFTVVSDDGSSLLYVLDDELFIYRNGKSEIISDNAENLVNAVISPNGSAVAYYTQNEEYEYECYAYNGKETVEFGEYYPVAISNNASVLYMVKSKDSKLCVVEKLDEETEKTLEVYANYYYYGTYLSNDHKSIVFTDGEATYLYSPSFEEAIRVSKDTVSLIFPSDSTRTLGNFDDFIGFSNNAAYRFTRNGDEFEKYKISNMSSYKLSSNGKKLAYTDDEELYLISTTSEKAEEVELADDVYSFCGASSDLKHIYYISDNELWYTNGREDGAVKICSDINGGIVTPDGVCIFSDEDDELYYSDKGSEKKKAEGVDEVEDGTESGNLIFIFSDDELYISSDGRKYEKSDIEIE